MAIPWKNILFSIPVWSVFITNLLFFAVIVAGFVAYLPIYVKEILGFSVTEVLCTKLYLLKDQFSAMPSSVHKHKLVGTHQHLRQLFQGRQQIDRVSRKVGFGIPFRRQ